MLQPKRNAQQPICSPMPQDLRQLFTEPLCGAIEAILFAATRPISLSELQELLVSQEFKTNPQQIRDIIHMLMELYNHPGRGLFLQEVAGGWQFRTNPAYAMIVRQMLDPRAPRFTQAALECLSIIAYRQPVTRGEVDAIRGVDSGGVLLGLRERGLVEIAGRSESAGRPYLYQTSASFLEFFGLNDLQELPNLLAGHNASQG